MVTGAASSGHSIHQAGTVIVLIKKFGNHSNRLIQNLHFEAFCLEHGIEFANATFDDMSRYYFSPPPRRPMSGVRRLFIAKVMPKLSKMNIPANVFSFDTPESNDRSVLLNRSKTCYVKGWQFRVHDLTAKYQDEFISRYSLKPEFYSGNALCKQFDEIDRDKSTVVGVHVRRGDYRTHLGGKYFFDDATYQKYIENFDAHLQQQGSSKNIFVIFSNEDITLNTSSQIVKSDNPWYVDQHLMSRCDYLIGPPSTFTMWASYIGKNRCFRIENTSGDISTEQFNYVLG